MRSLLQRIIPPALLALSAALPLAAQLIAPKPGENVPAFEVATVRKSAEGAERMMMRPMADNYQMENIALRRIILNAYGLTSDAQLIGSNSLLDQNFDIHAKADAEASARIQALPREDRPRETGLMVQALLADRFHLKVHIETRELPVYAMVVAKGGLKLKASAPPPETPDAPATPPPPPSPNEPLHKPPQGGMMMRMSENGVELNASAMNLSRLAMILTNQPETEGRVVIDKTGLTDKYDFSLNWTPTGNMAIKGMDNGAHAASDQPDAPGLFPALEEQLGLRLEPTKGQVPVVVIDHIEAPSAN